jgi:hypothetical protein
MVINESLPVEEHYRGSGAVPELLRLFPRSARTTPA